MYSISEYSNFMGWARVIRKKRKKGLLGGHDGKNFEKHCSVFILACIAYLVVVVGQWFATSVTLLPREHLAISGDIFDFHDGVMVLLAPSG